jgi:hypothetical protein
MSRGMTTAAIQGTDADGSTIREIANEAFAALNSGGRHVLPFSTRYPAFGLNDAYRVTALANNMRVMKWREMLNADCPKRDATVEPRSGLRTSGMTETFDAAKTALRDSYDKGRAWATKAGGIARLIGKN